MVNHIVMWNFKEEIEESKKESIKKDMEINLKALVGQVPGLLTVEFVSSPISSSTHDIALVTTLESLRRDILATEESLGLTPRGLLKLDDKAFEKQKGNKMGGLI